MWTCLLHSTLPLSMRMRGQRRTYSLNKFGAFTFAILCQWQHGTRPASPLFARLRLLRPRSSTIWSGRGSDIVASTCWGWNEASVAIIANGGRTFASHNAICLYNVILKLLRHRRFASGLTCCGCGLLHRRYLLKGPWHTPYILPVPSKLSFVRWEDCSALA